MTEPEEHRPTETLDPETAPEPEPEPEPWTPERVVAWNAYYDLYVAIGVLLLVFTVSAVKISKSSIWPLLQAGRLTAETGAPVVRDVFSYTEAGQRWVNIPWIFEWANALIYQAIAPANLARDPGQMTKADQVASGTLVALNAALRVLTALLLLGVRRPGPGLWWTAVCVGLALGGATAPPLWLELGGIAGQPEVAPWVWGHLLLALELYLLHRALNLGRRNALLALPVLFLAWANIDESFLFGLSVLAASVFGMLLQPASKGEARALAPGRGLAILGASLAACLVNPSFYRVFLAALGPWTILFGPDVREIPTDLLSVFGAKIGSEEGLGAIGQRWLMGQYLIVVGLGLFSFFLARRQFSLSRFLAYAVAAALWAVMIGYRDEFALVWAATLALNGQEWFQDRFGVRGRLGRPWAIWSVGGRAVTIILTFAFVAKAMTGYGIHPQIEQPFGFGANADLFPFEAADILRTAPLQGNVLNTSKPQGDAVVWRAYPFRKTFIDSRQHIFPGALLARWHEVRRALLNDDVARWKPALDESKITAVMLEVSGPNASGRTYDRLRTSPNWILFHFDGRIVMFGRADASAPDIDYFKEHRLDAEEMVYRRPQSVPPAERPPSPTTPWLDQVFKSRYLTPTQPHVLASRRWLEFDPAQGTLPGPANCIMAVREARIALSRQPDDPSAYRALAEAYQLLALNEAAILAGRSLTPATIGSIQVPVGLLSTRTMQRATAVSQAIQTTPPPQSPESWQDLAMLQNQLAEIYLARGYLDLALARFQAALDAATRAGISRNHPQMVALQRQVAGLEDQKDQAETRLSGLTDPQQADPVMRAQYALRLGLVQTAIDELSEAEAAGARSGTARPLLLDLFCQIGQPDRAVDLLGSTEDPALSTGPGTPALRQGLVSLLIGYYENTTLLWQDKAIPQLRASQALQALAAGQAFLRGEIRPATEQLLELPARVSTQAGWEFDLAQVLLESGSPAGAATHYTKALELEPELPLRPLIAYYLERLGKPVPPPTRDATKAGAAPAAGAKPPDQPAPPAGAAPSEKEASPPPADQAGAAEPAKSETKP